jgi:hypothetical protein
MSGAPPGRFSRAGLGFGLASSFDVAVARRQPALLRGPRGRQLLITCDIGGSQRDQPFETYSFLILDLDRNGQWLAMQQGFRAEVMPHRRRISFKAMNDGVRRRALPDFLALSEFLDAVLVTFAVHKTDRPQIGVDPDLVAELAGLWKPAVLDRLMWVVYLSAFLVSGFAAASQDIMFIIDEDEIAANVTQLTELTQLFGRACSAQELPMMGHLRVGTTKSDDGSLALEDLAAIPDLAAGGIGEFTQILQRDGAGPLSPILQRLPPAMTWKTRTLMAWLMRRGDSLARFTCIIDARVGSPKWRVTIPEWFAVDDPTRLQV